MTRLEVFDPPLCCSTGVCGPEVDPELPRFAGDLAWLSRSGVEVVRFNLAQQPEAFARNPIVLEAMKEGDDALPLLLVDGRISCRGRYPSRGELAAWTGLAYAAAETAPSSLSLPTASCCDPDNGSSCC